MTADIALVLVILLVALVLFFSEIVRMDIVALLVLVALAFTGLVTPTEAISGFSNAAVITVWAMFILSEGLTETGVAGIVGKQVLKLAGKTEVRMIVVIMLSSGVLSAFMNNIGVAAFMLPVVISVARKTGVPASRLLMPLAFGSLLGGLTTMIGTPPNLLVSNGLEEMGYEPFAFFDFSPIGGMIMIAGTVFVALTARFLLPSKDPGAAESTGSHRAALQNQYALGERAFFLKLGHDSTLAGKTLQQSSLARSLGFYVVALQRNGQTLFAPGPDTVLRAGDRLYTQGEAERLEELRSWQDLKPVGREAQDSALLSGQFTIAEATLSDKADFLGKTIREADFRKRFNSNVLMVFKTEGAAARELGRLSLQAGDRLLLQGGPSSIEALKSNEAFSRCQMAPPELLNLYTAAEKNLFKVIVPESSWLAGKGLKESRLRQRFDLHVISIEREGTEFFIPDPNEPLREGDKLTLHCRRENYHTLQGLQQLEVETSAQFDAGLLQTEEVEMIEATLAPNSKLAGRTVADIHLRKRYGIQLLGILRADEVYRSHLGRMKIHFGDALLLMGPKDKLDLLREDKNFLLLTQLPETQAAGKNKPLLATLIMMGVVVPVFLGWMPIAITAIAGASAMMLTGCLTRNKAFRAIQWRPVFLIAGMLPLGTAMQKTGAASYLAELLLSAIGGFGPWAVIAGLYLITSLATTIIPTAALVVLMTPIAIQSSVELGIPPYTAMMALAMAASASFTSPISHPANVLVMGPGGYRFSDYLKVGLPLALVVFITAMIGLPLLWPIP